VSHQQSDKHGPAIDDALTNERRQASAGTRHNERPEEVELSARDGDAVELRSDLGRFLGPAAFPGTAGDLLATARDNHATVQVVRLLQSAPDRVYRTVEEIWDAVYGPMDV
jgi:hypothetical protein